MREKTKIFVPFTGGKFSLVCTLGACAAMSLLSSSSKYIKEFLRTEKSTEDSNCFLRIIWIDCRALVSLVEDEEDR